MISPTNGEDPTGPSDSTLRSLRGMMPKLAEGIKSNKIGGKGKILQVTRPRKICPICMAPHDRAIAPPDLELKPEVCPECQKMLNQGYTALTSDKRYAFVKSSKLSEFAGKIMPIDKEVMDAVEKANEGKNGEVNGHEHKAE